MRSFLEVSLTSLDQGSPGLIFMCRALGKPQPTGHMCCPGHRSSGLIDLVADDSISVFNEFNRKVSNNS